MSDRTVEINFEPVAEGGAATAGYHQYQRREQFAKKTHGSIIIQRSHRHLYVLFTVMEV